MKSLLLLISILLFGCASQESNDLESIHSFNENIKSNEAFTEYESYYFKHKKNTSDDILFREYPVQATFLTSNMERELGWKLSHICMRYPKKNILAINRENWENFSSIEKRNFFVEVYRACHRESIVRARN